jgi:hypothetical protein
MPHTTQEEFQEGDHLRRAFTPTWIESILLVIFSFLALIGLNSMSAFKTLDGVHYDQVADLLKTYTQKILAPTNKVLQF